LLQNHVHVPSLSQYSRETRHLFLASVVEDLRRVAGEELAHMDECEPENDSSPGPSPDWRSALENASRFRLGSEAVEFLLSVDWPKLGEFRGMRAVLRRMMNGQSAQDAVLACESIVAGERQSTEGVSS
jgi:hypothetical protein